MLHEAATRTCCPDCVMRLPSVLACLCSELQEQPRLAYERGKHTPIGPQPLTQVRAGLEEQVIGERSATQALEQGVLLLPHLQRTERVLGGRRGGAQKTIWGQERE